MPQTRRARSRRLDPCWQLAGWRLGAAAVAATALAACSSAPEPASNTPPQASADAPAPAEGARVAAVSDAEIARVAHGPGAVVLKDGRVIAAGAEDTATAATSHVQLFDPKARAWIDAAPLATARRHHATAALADGRALVCGGDVAAPAKPPAEPAPIATCELFDPTTSRWSAAPSMTSPRRRFTLTTLGDGRVLAVGDPGCELFDPVKAAWSTAPATSVGYIGHTATLLQDGRVLVVGSGATAKASAEAFDAKAAAWTVEPAPSNALVDHTATTLLDGSVLVVGGSNAGASLQSGLAFATVYEPKRQRWNFTGQPHSPHWRHAAVLLPSGDVLVTGGERGDPELYVREIWRDLTPDLATRLEQLRPQVAPPRGGSAP